MLIYDPLLQESFHPLEVTEGLWIVPEWRTPLVRLFKLFYIFLVYLLEYVSLYEKPILMISITSYR